jgi:hypothetical protein
VRARLESSTLPFDNGHSFVSDQATSSSFYDSADDVCVVCKAADRKVGLVHGDEMCLCLCKRCASCGLYGSGCVCPMCGQPVQKQLDFQKPGAAV